MFLVFLVFLVVLVILVDFGGFLCFGVLVLGLGWDVGFWWFSVSLTFRFGFKPFGFGPKQQWRAIASQHLIGYPTGNMLEEGTLKSTEGL